MVRPIMEGAFFKIIAFFVLGARQSVSYHHLPYRGRIRLAKEQKDCQTENYLLP